MYVHGIRKLFAFPGWVVEKIDTDGVITNVRVRRDRRRTTRCPYCDRQTTINRRTEQLAWDLPVGISQTVAIHYEAVQMRCRGCNGYSTLRPPGIDHKARATDRLKRFVSRACRFLPLARVRDLIQNVDESTARRWDKAVLKETLGEPDLDGLRVLLIDEKHVWRGHNGFVTIVMNAVTGEPLHMVAGKKGESLAAFFEKLTDQQKASIEAVGIDRAGSYKSVVETQLPTAKIVFDKFHLIQNYHQVIDEVRREEWRAANKKDKKVIKGQRYNLFRKPEKNTDDQHRSLWDLLEINENLHRVYVLLDAFKDVWTYVYPGAAKNYLEKWVGWANETGVPELVRFAKNVWKAREQIVAYCKYPVTMGKIEGFNNTVSRLVHRACGVRDLAYLFLKCRQAAEPAGELVPVSDLFD